MSYRKVCCSLPHIRCSVLRDPNESERTGVIFGDSYTVNVALCAALELADPVLTVGSEGGVLVLP